MRIGQEFLQEELSSLLHASRVLNSIKQTGTGLRETWHSAAWARPAVRGWCIYGSAPLETRASQLAVQSASEYNPPGGRLAECSLGKSHTDPTRTALEGSRKQPVHFTVDPSVSKPCLNTDSLACQFTLCYEQSYQESPDTQRGYRENNRSE